MKIVSLEASNVKRINAVQITPDGALVVIGGKNAQGKTSVLDSIMMALAGGKAVPEKPIKDGEKEAEIRLDLGEIVVVRRFSEKTGTSLIVTDGATGAKITSPQSILDKLTSKIAFDPLAFSRMKPLDQFEELRKLLGLDFSEADCRRAKIYGERTVKNRELESQQHRVRTMPHFPNAPEKAPDAAELSELLRKRSAWNEENRQAREALAEAEESHVTWKNQVEKLTAELERAKEHHANCVKLVANLKPAAEREDADTSEVSAEIEAMSNTRSEVEANARRAAEMLTLRSVEKEAREMTAEIEKIDEDKAKKIAETKFPIPGLGFAESAVTFNGLPFAQASGAEQLRASVAMGMAMNPKLKVLLVRDGSLLDEDNLKVIAEMAEANGAQVWIERVGKGAECSVIIEDGHVIEDRTASKKAAKLSAK